MRSVVRVYHGLQMELGGVEDEDTFMKLEFELYVESYVMYIVSHTVSKASDSCHFLISQSHLFRSTILSIMAMSYIASFLVDLNTKSR